MKELRKPGAQIGNTNRATLVKHGLKPGIAVHVSVHSERRHSIEAKLASELGREPSEDEVKTKIRSLALQAIDAYIDSQD
jgi:hypothetical protein